MSEQNIFLFLHLAHFSSTIDQCPSIVGKKYHLVLQLGRKSNKVISEFFFKSFYNVAWFWVITNCISFWLLVRCPNSQSEPQLFFSFDDALPPTAVVLKRYLHGSWSWARSWSLHLSLDMMVIYNSIQCFGTQYY